VSDSALFDQAVANLRRLSAEIRAAGDPAGLIPARAAQCWADQVDTAAADLLEVQRRARYADVFAVAAALVDVTIERPSVAPEPSSGLALALGTSMLDVLQPVKQVLG
jgi:hypothetical protein